MANQLNLPVAKKRVKISVLDTVNEKCRLFTDKFEGLNLEDDRTVLIIPTVGKVNAARFPLNGEYLYIRRKKFMGSLVAVVVDWLNHDCPAMSRTVLGFRRSGKSYALATFVCALRSKNYKVLYIHNCSYWAADPLNYLKKEAFSTFYGDREKQTELEGASTQQQILEILTSEHVIVVADQVGGLYQKYTIPGQGLVQTKGSLSVLDSLSFLSTNTLVFMAASAQKTDAFVNCLNNCDKTETMELFDGFSPEEFEVFKLLVPAYCGLDSTVVEKLEKLTGFLPGLLTLPRAAEFCVSHTPLVANQPYNDDWFRSLELSVVEFVEASTANTRVEHKASHEAAVFGTPYSGDQSRINFDIVSLPDKNRVVVCPSDFCKDLLSDHMVATDLNHKKKRLEYLHTEMIKENQEPTKLGDAAEDYLIAFMEVHMKCPMKIPNTSPALLPFGYIPLMAYRKFDGLCPNTAELYSDYICQDSPGAATPSAVAYFPKGKFLRYIDFVLRVLIKRKDGEKDLMVVVVGQITLSEPTRHGHTWKFFETDYLGWKGGYEPDKVDTKFVLAWFTPHQMPDLSSFSFSEKGITGEAVNIAFDTFSATDGALGSTFSPLCNPDHYKCCGCKSGTCPEGCGCRKGRIPCR